MSLSPRTLRLAAWIAIDVVLVINEGRLIRTDPVLTRDDTALIGPLATLHGLSSYVEGIRHGAILDVQPVRDLSFWIDLKLHALTGLSTFHLTNALLLVGILALLHLLLLRRFRSEGATAAALVLYACHPVVANTVSWIAARKHLLSVFLILAATLVATSVKRERATWRVASIVLYALSVLAQPITLLWPLWLGLDTWVRERKLRSSVLDVALHAPITLGVGVLNFLYYSTVFVTAAHGTKFAEGVEGAQAVSFLALGRYFFNAVLPVAISTSYDPGRVFGLVGLLLLPVAVFLSFKLAPRGQVAVGWGLFFFPLVTVVIKPTNIFVSDTYLLLPLVGLAFVALAIFEQQAAAAPLAARLGAGCAVVVAVTFAFSSHAVAASWSSEAALWNHAFHTEPTPNVLAKQAFYLVQAGRAAEALPVAERLLAWAPQHPEAAYVYGRAVYFDQQLTPAEKLARLQGAQAHNAWTSYYEAVIEAQLGQYGQALQSITPVADSASQLGKAAATAAAEARFFCARAQADPEVCARLTERFRASAGPSWVAEAYDARAKSLGLEPATGQHGP